LYRYIHQRPGWPHFKWDRDALSGRLAALRHEQGRLLGRMEGLGFALRQEAVLGTLTEDVLKSSEIEGERLDAEMVRSSIARRLGMPIAGLRAADRNVDGVVEMMLDATRNYGQALTRKRLFGWHTLLFPLGYNGMRRIATGRWRSDSNGPMQVVSGPIGRERVHFEAPGAERLPDEMKLFLDWFNAPQADHTEDADWVVRAALAHLWFVTVHPFDDGNGRMARAIADMALARSEGSVQRCYSMSAQIRVDRSAYYATLERTQKGTLDVTGWMDWFLGCMGRAIKSSQTTLARVMAKARLWETLADESINSRQRLMLNLLLNGFEGKLTSSKWAKLAKCSQDTAARDIQTLIDLHVLARSADGGRSTSYELLLH